MSTIVPLSNDDPEKLFVCPYDHSHKVRACRFNQHVLKCQKNHGERGFSICIFNQSHHIPTKDIEHHLMHCPDKVLIQQDVDSAQRSYKNPLPQVNHHPVWNKPDATEDWDTEGQAEQTTNQTYLLQQSTDPVPDDVADEVEIRSLIPEKPHNWESMTTAQKKNYRRRYNKQQEKLKEKGLTPADFEKSKNPKDWTEREREAKIGLIISLYPPPKVGGTFVDYKSILNQYCQKNKINPPKYKEAPGSFAGFASVVVVDGMEYRCNGVHTAKKLAAHDAAKWALMAMEVTEDQMNQHNCCTKLRPARTAHDVEFLRSANEVGRLHLANQTQLPPKQGVPRPVQQNPVPPVDEAQLSLRPHTLENERNDVTESLQKLSVGAQETTDKEWQTVGNRSAKQGGQRLRGRGRGTALSSW